MIEDAVSAGELAGIDIDKATYFVCSLRDSYNTSIMLGNDVGPALPDIVDLSVFCLGGMGGAASRLARADRPGAGSAASRVVRPVSAF